MHTTTRRITGICAVTAAASGLLLGGTASSASAGSYDDYAKVRVATKADGGDRHDYFKYSLSTDYKRWRFTHYGHRDSDRFRIYADREYKVDLRHWDDDCEFEDVYVDGLDYDDYYVHDDYVVFEAGEDDYVKITYKFDCDDDYDDDDDYKASQV